MAVTVVQAAFAVPAFGSSANATFGSALTPGNKIIAIGGTRDTDSTMSISGFTQVRHQHWTSDWPCAWIFYRDIVGGDGTSWSVSNSTRCRAILIEVSGLASGTASSSDGLTGFFSGSGAFTGNAMTSGGFIVAAMVSRGATSLSSVNNSFVNMGNNGLVNSSLAPYVTGIYKISTSSETPSISVNDRGNCARAQATWAEATPSGGGARSQSLGVF